jgi:putative ABC transport system permease protein
MTRHPHRDDIEREIEFQIQETIDVLMAQGMPEDKARAEAVRRFGDRREHARAMLAAHRGTRGFPRPDGWLRDVRYSLRTMRRDAGLTIFAVLIVGLGVGASVTVFSVVNAMWLRPLPFANPAQLAWISNGTSDNLSNQTVQVNNALDFRGQSQSFAAVAGFSPFYGVGDIRLTGSGDAERVTGVPITEGFFELLGVQPALGRFFSADECRWNGPKAALLSHAFWQRRYAGDVDVVGGTIVLDGVATTVVGVLPAAVDFPALFTPAVPADVFVPYALAPETNRQGNTLALIGRLKPGVVVDAAQTEATTIAETIRMTPHEGEGRGRNRFQPRLSGLSERVSGRFHFGLVTLVGASAVLMLLVCTNLANLLLGRATAREQEMALRLALGATRRNLVRQMLLESLVLSTGGAVVGFALAMAGTHAVSQLEGTTVPLLTAVRVDGMALAFTLLSAVLTGVTFGMLPAVQASSTSPERALRAGNRGSTSGSGATLWRVIVVAEIALACVLLTGAGLLGHSLMRLLDVDPGFNAENVLTLRVDPGKEHATATSREVYFDDLLRSVRDIPGVEAVGLTDALPLGDNYGWRRWSTGSQERVDDQSARVGALVRIVDAGYFDALTIASQAGRTLTSADRAGSERVVVLNDVLAHRLWPNVEAVGQTMVVNDNDWRVVGVVRETRYFGLERHTDPEFYLSISQAPDYSSVDLVVRTSGPPASVVGAVRAALATVDPTLPTLRFRELSQLVARSTFSRRAIATLVIGFAAFGLVLASLGIYAVISQSVSRRRQEIGIRVALGASPRDVRVAVVVETTRLVLAGLAVGVAASVLTAWAMRGLLFGVTFVDPLTFAGVIVLLAGVSVLAGYVPARRASRIDPLVALRS